MKIICSKSNLLQGINMVLRAVPAHSSLNVLECILFDVSEDTITLTGSNMELGIETKVVGDILEPGRIALNAKFLSDIVRKLADNNITIETDEYHHASISCEKAKFDIPGRSGDDFPELPSVDKNVFITLNQFSFRSMINETIFSTSDIEENKLMTGESIKMINGKVRITSLDGHRIAMRYYDIKANEGEAIDIIVPGKALADLARIVQGDSYSEITMYVTQYHALFEFDQTRVVARLLEGKYYPVDQMITDDYDTKIEVNKADFISCLDRSILLTSGSDSKPIVFNLVGNNMELTIQSDSGSMRENIEVVKEGKDFRAGFNPKFLLDAFRAIDDETISIYFINDKTPCSIKNDNKDYIYIILPVTIS
ncbi:MAG: DNA polymerase III subunit beta [Lachnospiraceae bacterium]|nr:DNA polymerase III subunit beta [Lachnospiraceae bacterium]